MTADTPRTIGIPYGHGSLELALREGDRVIEGEISAVAPSAPAEELVRRALESPLGTPRLSELARDAHSVVIVTSDHTRAMPSAITLPLLLEEVRRGNPDAEITILVATGLHRATTPDEQRAMFGSKIVESERIVVHDAFDESAHVDLGTLPSGACFFVDRLVTTCDLLVTEGFIEPHFFAGFSGGRKSILPGVCSERAVKENHSYRAIASDRARSAVLDGNPIHLDMVEAARRVNVAFILNVALNGSKEIIGAWAGDVERAHEEGVRFVSGLTQRPVETADIVITGNGGYPLDQNLYQSPKAASTAAEYAGEDGVIILCCRCEDGMGSENFERLMQLGSPEEIDAHLSAIPAHETIPEQWCAQIYSRILRRHRLILVSDGLDPKLVSRLNMTPARTLDEALALARDVKGADASVIVIPDGVNVVPASPAEEARRATGQQESQRPLALKVADADNVATVFADGTTAGTVVCVRDRAGNESLVTALGDIPYGHKIAIADIAAGQTIVKYGESIGVASREIAVGDYVHVHNLDSMRGRGDLEQGSPARPRPEREEDDDAR
ncbi:MAG TPA: nickel-dependent lactate racemase [Candidatus Olsenella avicola]|nr:nickel-dependent lactate racemase [Candidatus Olsenella avicola]